ncbi:hypothetical protein [Candidatus Paracaedibacter symbiosus]|uniref:hypothetical protein n=1 Tax=Candidatus Paracaedibacter symbiosus TaxID=244582 RepID=UPI0018DBCFBC|nr:hypothetical protein [Candidatus Paracaedibacter symbiosus]
MKNYNYARENVTGNNYKKIRGLLLLSAINLCWQSTALAMDNPNPMGKIAADLEDCGQQRQPFLTRQRVEDDTSPESLAVGALVVDHGIQPLLAIESPNNPPRSNFAESTVHTTGDNPFEWLPLEVNYHIFQFLDSNSAKQAALVSHAFNSLENLTRRHLRVKDSITAEKLIEFVTKYPHLTSLDLGGVPTDQGCSPHQGG